MIIQSAMEIIKQLNLSSETLFCTLGIGVYFGEPKFNFQFYLWGDGVIACENENGKINYFHVEYSNEMPYYPIYETNKKMNDEYSKHNIIKNLRFTDGSS